MRSNRVLVAAAFLLTLLVGAAVAEIPARLTDEEFWRLVENVSEADGAFRSDNLLSNEMVFARLLPELSGKTKPGGVFMGVGPEQNFTYITAMKSKMAFIIDIRRENLHVLLMYKAVFELSKDRADFIALLFSRPRPAGLTTKSTITEIMDAYWDGAASDTGAFAANLQRIQTHLTKTHALPLSQADRDGVAQAYRAFYTYGPRMNYAASLSLASVSAGGGATYRDLMTQKDAEGRYLTFLASEETFGYVKDLEAKNLIIPVVGDFGGPKAIRGIGAYVKSRGANVSAFYVSTVEPYLKRAGTFTAFCENVATLPLNEQSVFIRPGNIGNLQQSGFAVAPADANTPRIGQYQVGVIVPMKNGCS